MAAGEGTVLGGVPNVGDVVPRKDKLMMFGSNLLQFGGALIMGPCERIQSEVSIVVMVGDMLYDDYMKWHLENIDELARFYTGSKFGSNEYFVPHDPRYSFTPPPPMQNAGAVRQWTDALGYSIGDSYWVDDKKGGLVGVADFEKSEATYGLAGTFPAKRGSGEFYLRFKLFFGLKFSGDMSGAPALVKSATVQRKVTFKVPPDDVDRDNYPANDDTHFYGDSIWVEIDEEYRPRPASMDEIIWNNQYPDDAEGLYDIDVIPKWNPGLKGDVPTLAACTFDESGKIKEILWQSK